MLKKVNKQREKIGKLMQKESDVADKLAALRQELEDEKAVLDEIEKECLFSLMCGKGLSLEETIAILESSKPLAMESVERIGDAFTGDVEVSFDPGENQGMKDEKTMEGGSKPIDGDAGTSGSIFSRLGKKEAGDESLWQ